MTVCLEDPTLWITSRRATSEGRACRVLATFAEDGAPLLEAIAFPWRREIVVRSSDTRGEALLILRRRRSFPVTGKVDVEDGDAHRLGIVTRAGRVLRADGTLAGRFSDSRSLRRRTAESAAEAVGNALIGVDSVGRPRAADSFVFSLDGHHIGSLVRAPLPFSIPESEAHLRAGIARLLPERWHIALARRAEPRGWRFARMMLPAHADPRLLVGAALFTIELSHW